MSTKKAKKAKKAKKLAAAAKELKDVTELLEKLRTRRREVKGLLQNDGLEDRREKELAGELAQLAKAIEKFEKGRKRRIASL